jgi:hypothetical protein
MAASEANRQRVLTLLRVEREQIYAELKNFYRERPSANRGKWAPPEIRQLATVDHFYSSQLNAF